MEANDLAPGPSRISGEMNGRTEYQPTGSATPAGGSVLGKERIRILKRRKRTVLQKRADANPILVGGWTEGRSNWKKNYEEPRTMLNG